jgi:hypothetical protein
VAEEQDPPALLRLAPLLRRQFGVVSAAQCTTVGVAPGVVARLRTRGLLVRLYRGVFRCAAVPDTWEGRLLAAQLGAGPHAVVGRWAAARLHGLIRGEGGTEVDLVLPRGRHPRGGGPTVRTSRRLREDDTVQVGRFRCGGVAWTLAELAAVADADVRDRVAARALAEGRCDLADLEALAERWRDVPGVVALRGLLPAGRDVVVGSRSREEASFVRLVVAAGLPRPLVNLRVTDADGGTRYLDAAWPDLLVCAEIDVHPEHATTLGRRLDGRRQNGLVPVWTVLRFDARDLHARPDEVVATVRRTLVAAGWDPGATIV